MGNAPKLRFEGFSGEWEKKNLCELMDFSNGFNGDKSLYGSGIKYISVMDILNNDYITYDCIQGSVQIDDDILSRFSVSYGDVLFQRSSENVDDAGTSNVYIDDKPAAFGGFVIRGKKKADYDAYFVKHLLDSDTPRKQIRTQAQGAQHINISQETLSQVSIAMPSLEEQSNVGKMFAQMNHLIALHQRKCDELAKAKQFYLQNLFPRKGARTPAIRFDGFTGDWERRKLGEVASSFEYGLNASAKEYDGINKYLRITDIDDLSHVFKDDDLTSPDVDLSNADNYLLHEGEILFARTGASVGKSYIYRNTDGIVYFAGFLIRAKIEPDYDTEFVFQNTLSAQYKNYIQISSQRSGQPGVNAQEYAEYSFLTPSYTEQKKIGDFLHHHDTLIAQQTRKLTALKIMKQLMLQNMFV